MDFPENLHYEFPKIRGVKGRLELFQKIHPFWYRHPPLTAHVLQGSKGIIIKYKFDKNSISNWWLLSMGVAPLFREAQHYVVDSRLPPDRLLAGFTTGPSGGWF